MLRTCKVSLIFLDLLKNLSFHGKDEEKATNPLAQARSSIQFSMKMKRRKLVLFSSENSNFLDEVQKENDAGLREEKRFQFRVDERSSRTKNKSEQKEKSKPWLNADFQASKRTQRISYYRKVLPLPVIKFPDFDANSNDILEGNLRNALLQLQLKGKEKERVKVFGGQKPEEAVKNPFRVKHKARSEIELERLERKRMEGKSGNSSGQQKFSKNDDHQSVVVNVRERKFPDDKKRVCSSAECKTFLGEANRNRKSKDLRNTEKLGVSKLETTEKYLQDSYNNAFQKHVDNLTNVISQHRTSTALEKPVTEVHIPPTENPKNRRNITPRPLSQLEIKNEAGINQKITFAQVEDDEDDLEDFSRMNQRKDVKKVNVLKEDFQEENIFEELIEPNPMITFNHVCSEAESSQLSFNQIKAHSRSPSPMLEVPDSKSCQKMASRPPL